MAEQKLRVLIVDDEPPAVRRIRALLEASADIEVVADCGDGHQALEAIRTHAPDLVFLDIHMPGLNGFEVIEQLPLDGAPAIIFVTAFDQHAIKAFEVRALDYLLKPFDRRRFAMALERARQHIAQQRMNLAKHPAVRKKKSAQDPIQTIERLAVKVDGRITLIPLDSIHWFESCGKYVNIHGAKETLLHRETLRSLETRLNTSQFLRIHRSALVNVHHVTDLEPVFHGDYVVRLKGGIQLPLGRKYRDRVRRLLGITAP